MIERRYVDNLTQPGLRAQRRDVVRIARGPMAGRVGTVEAVKGKYLTVRIEPKFTKTQQARISSKVGELRREGYGRAQAVRVAFSEEQERTPGMKFLINPPARSGNMALPKRDPRTGRFVSRGGSRRSHRKRNMPRGQHMSSAERSHLSALARSRPRNRFGEFVSEGGRRRNPRPRHRVRAYHHERWDAREHPRNRFGEFVRTTGRRHNPAGFGGFGRWIGEGFLGAGEVIASKAIVKVTPGLVKLPTTGNTAYAVQLLVAVGLGWVADRFGGERVGEYVLAGGLAAPIEQFIEDKQVPYLAPALQKGTLSAWSEPTGINAAAAQPAAGLPMSAWSAGAAALLTEG